MMVKLVVNKINLVLVKF